MLLGKRDVIGQPLSQFFNGSELEKLIQVLNKVSKSGNPVTPAPMNERASDYAGAPEDKFVQHRADTRQRWKQTKAIVYLHWEGLVPVS